MVEKQITITKISDDAAKKSEGQSCRYCPCGLGSWKVDSDEGTYYVCEEHKQDKGL